MLLKLLKLSNKIDLNNSAIADRLDRLVYSQTTPIDVRILQLQKDIEAIRQHRGDRAEIQALLKEIMRLKGMREVGSYMPIR